MSSATDLYTATSATASSERAQAARDLQARTAAREQSNAKLLGAAQPILDCLEALRKLDEKPKGKKEGFEYPGVDYILQITPATEDKPSSYYTLAIKHGMPAPFVDGYGTYLKARVARAGYAIPFLRDGGPHTNVPALFVVLRDDGYVVHEFSKKVGGSYFASDATRGMSGVEGLTGRQFLAMLTKWLAYAAPNRAEFLPILARAEAALPPDPEPVKPKKRSFLGMVFGR